MNQNNNDTLNKEGELYVKLGNLMRKKRTEDGRKTVETILNLNIPTAEKVQKITDFDATSHIGSNLYLLRKKSFSGEAAAENDKTALSDIDENTSIDNEKIINDTLASKGIFTPVIVKENRKKIQKFPKRRSYLFFLVSEFFRIIKFTCNSSVLRYKYFLPDIKLSRNIERFFSENIKKTADELAQVMHYISETGWMTLEKFEYNLLMEFRALCEKISAITGEPSRGGESGMLIRIRRVEKYFLVCHYRENYPEKILSLVEKTLKGNSRYSLKIKEIKDMIAFLLYTQPDNLSLQAIIVAFNIIESRTYLVLDDLINRNRGEIISNFEFNAHTDVAENIKEAIHKNIDNLNCKLDEKRRILKIKFFMKLNESGGYDFSILNSAAAGIITEDLIPVMPNVALFGYAMIKCYLVLFEELLLKPVTFSDHEPALLFDGDFFQAEHVELQNIFNRMEKLSKQNNCLQITSERLDQHLKNKLTIVNRTKLEIETIQDIDRFSSLMYNVGHRLSVIYMNKNIAPDTNNDAVVTADHANKPGNELPFIVNKIVSQHIFSGKSVAEAIYLLISISYMAAYYFRNQKICLLLDNIVKIKKEIDDIMAQLKRLADPLHYEKIEQIKSNSEKEN
ncbi:MAG: hypothetical protein A2096_00905 [Spirochaetes bacterium GWF1_41_5]|nr:MAG: hypothetical protein A2096_00905 [Spirochaetes bacterium GWF1_41_5]HBE02964.1 hypothetical protein [Spirochaetia bacterium]